MTHQRGTGAIDQRSPARRRRLDGSWGKRRAGHGIAHRGNDLDARALNHARDRAQRGADHARRIDARLVAVGIERRDDPRAQRERDRRGERERVEVRVVMRAEPSMSDAVRAKYTRWLGSTMGQS